MFGSHLALHFLLKYPSNGENDRGFCLQHHSSDNFCHELFVASFTDPNALEGIVDVKRLAHQENKHYSCKLLRVKHSLITWERRQNKPALDSLENEHERIEQ